MKKIKKKLYWIKDNEKDSSLCPLCSSKLDSCHIGCFCSKPKCPYVDGGAFLTDNQAKKYRKHIITIMPWKTNV
jgi:hypothetical protein